MTGFAPDRQAPKFPSGQLVATPNAIRSLVPEDVKGALARHFQGDWGECDSHDWGENDRCLQYGGRLFSVFRDSGGVKFWIITEADRSVTTVLLPEDY